MTSEAKHPDIPFSGAAPDGEPPKPECTPNLFMPISTENRITGQSRVHRQHAQSQLVPGSNYDYGRSEYLNTPATSPDSFSGEAALGYQKSVPPTFLHRTLAEPGPVADTFNPVNRPFAGYPGSPYLWAGAPFGIPVAQSEYAVQIMPGGDGMGIPPASQQAVGQAAAETSPVPAPATNAGGAMQTAAPLFPAGADFQAQPFGIPTAPASAVSAALGYGGADAAQPLGNAAFVGAAMPGIGPYAPAPGERYGAYTGQTYNPEPPAPEASYVQSYPQPAAPEYVPRHGHTASDRVAASPTLPEAALDPWEAMGWKAPDNQAFENTAVWRVSDLTMFERGAFEEPLNPFADPAAIPVFAADPYAAPGVPGMEMPDPPTRYPYGETASAGEPPAADGYMPYAETEASAYNQPYPERATLYDAALPDESDANPAYTPAPPRPPMAPNKPRPQAPPPPRGLSAVAPWRLALWIGCALALLFCGIEVVKIVESLVTNEQDMRHYREEYYQLAGVDPNSTANGVELLPPGQTYTPTATPVPVLTPTPEPRIAQNDPLIGVIDNGGQSTVSFSPSLPSDTPLVRTRLSKYPDNALLSISDAFTELRQQNPDVVGRLTIEGVLDETLVQRNNTFYLTHNVRGLYGKTGAVFVDEGCSLKKPPENLLLRGQTNTEGKLFAPLLQYGAGGSAFIKNHGIVTCDTIYEQSRYVIFAVVKADSDVGSKDYFNFAGYLTFQTDTQMLNYVAAARAHSVCPIDVGVRADDRLLTLATITEGNDTACWVIFCRRLRNGEADGNIQRD